MNRYGQDGQVEVHGHISKYRLLGAFFQGRLRHNIRMGEQLLEKVSNLDNFVFLNCGCNKDGGSFTCFPPPPCSCSRWWMSSGSCCCPCPANPLQVKADVEFNIYIFHLNLRQIQCWFNDYGHTMQMMIPIIRRVNLNLRRLVSGQQWVSLARSQLGNQVPIEMLSWS